MASVLGLLEAREKAAGELIERLRGEADRVLAELGEAERGLEWLVIARETVAEVLSGPAVREPEVPVGSAGVVPLGARTAGGGVRARELTVALGREEVTAKIESVRSMAKRLVARGWAVEALPGVFTVAAGSDGTAAGG